MKSSSACFLAQYTPGCPIKADQNEQLLNETHFLSDFLTLGEPKMDDGEEIARGCREKLRIIDLSLEEGNYKN